MNIYYITAYYVYTSIGTFFHFGLPFEFVLSQKYDSILRITMFGIVHVFFISRYNYLSYHRRM